MRPAPKARLAAVDGATIDDEASDPEREIIAAWIDDCIEHTGDDRKDRPTTSELLASLDAYCLRRRARKVVRNRMTAILTDLLKPEKVGGRFPRQRSERVWPGYRIRDPKGRRDGR